MPPLHPGDDLALQIAMYFAIGECKDLKPLASLDNQLAMKLGVALADLSVEVRPSAACRRAVTAPSAMVLPTALDLAHAGAKVTVTVRPLSSDARDMTLPALRAHLVRIVQRRQLLLPTGVALQDLQLRDVALEARSAPSRPNLWVVSPIFVVALALAILLIFARRIGVPIRAEPEGVAAIYSCETRHGFCTLDAEEAAAAAYVSFRQYETPHQHASNKARREAPRTWWSRRVLAWGRVALAALQSSSID